MQLCSSLKILWHCLSMGLEWKWTFSSPVATAEFSKFPGILSPALLQHHLLVFERAIPSPLLALFIVMLPKVHLPSHSRMSGSMWVITPSWLSGSCSPFCIGLLCILATSSRYLLLLLGPYHFYYCALLCMKCFLNISIFLKRSLFLPILLFFSISLHWSLRKAFLSLLLCGTLYSNWYIFPFLLCL